MTRIVSKLQDSDYLHALAKISSTGRWFKEANGGPIYATDPQGVAPTLIGAASRLPVLSLRFAYPLPVILGTPPASR
jgi:hypothetical protein